MAREATKKASAAAANQKESATPAKRRGRPAGSKKSAKKTSKSASNTEAMKTKGKRGRPPGSKNKTKELKSVAAGTKSLSMDLNDIQALISFVSKSGVSEVDLETQGVKIVIKTTSTTTYVAAPVAVQQPVAAPAPVHASAPATPAPATPAPATPAAADESKYITIKSPMIGTFYRKPGPDKPLFVNVGDEIKPGKVLCIIEAMKLFNEIEAEISGKIVKILVDDASPVEYDQPLFLVDPS